MENNENKISINPERTILYLSKLSEKINDYDIQRFFQDYKNDIIMTQIDHNFDNCSEMNLAPRVFVEFKDPEKAKEAFNALSMRKLKGKTVYIQYHKNQIMHGQKENNIFIKGLPLYVSQREIFEKFAEYGEIISSKLCEDEEGNHLGYGYFNYANFDSVNKILEDVSKQVKFFGAQIQVAQFKRKFERDMKHIIISKNKNIYIKNLPETFEQEDLINKFSKYGQITWSTLKRNLGYNSKYAIISYDSEESSKIAIENENDKDGIYVGYLQTKEERRKIISNKKIMENTRLTTQYRKCNLHIRNLPVEINEEILCETLEKYGAIKSLKIPRFILVSKINNTLQESTMSKQFCYVCFEKDVEAIAAMKDLNGKIYPGFENSINRPLIIEYFMPKQERNKLLSNVYNILDNRKLAFNPMFGSSSMISYPLYMHPTLAKHVRKGFKGYPNRMYPQNMNNYNQLPQPMQQQQQQKQEENKEKPEDNKKYANINYVNSLPSEEDKKDYLGEMLYFKIEKHHLSKKYNLSVDNIGKITGMILGIENLNEICEIINHYSILSKSIEQAIQLLGIQK